MKTEDFERLKEICEKEGFTLHGHSSPEVGQMVTVILSKKDPWDGVEFAKLGQIHKIKSIEKNRLIFDSDTWAYKQNCEPSTESAYVEQLKKEAFERFGEIKEGDRFKRDHISVNWGKDEPVKKILDESFDFKYTKSDDILYKGNLAIYKQGNWAEMVKVTYIDWEYANNKMEVNFSFKINDWKTVKDKDDVGDFLAQKLETYLGYDK